MMEYLCKATEQHVSNSVILQKFSTVFYNYKIVLFFYVHCRTTDTKQRFQIFLNYTCRTATNVLLLVNNFKHFNRFEQQVISNQKNIIKTGLKKCLIWIKFIYNVLLIFTFYIIGGALWILIRTDAIRSFLLPGYAAPYHSACAMSSSYPVKASDIVFKKNSQFFSIKTTLAPSITSSDPNLHLCDVLSEERSIGFKRFMKSSVEFVCCFIILTLMRPTLMKHLSRSMDSMMYKFEQYSRIIFICK